MILVVSAAVWYFVRLQDQEVNYEENSNDTDITSTAGEYE